MRVRLSSSFVPAAALAAVTLCACQSGPFVGSNSPLAPTSIARSRPGAMSVQIATPGSFSDAKFVKIFDNLAQFPSGTYWGGDQVVIVGGNGNNTFLDNQVAAAFTPSSNHTATQIEVAVLAPLLQGYGSSGFTLDLDQDNNGVPGTTLLSAQLPSLPSGFPICCALIIGKIPNGIALTGGKQYWVAVDGKNGQSNDAAGWDENATDQLHPQLNAVYCAYASSCPKGPGWYPFQSNLGFGAGLAFAVLGNS